MRRRLSSGDAASVVGLLQHLVQAYTGRIGSERMAVLKERQYANSTEWTQAFQEDVDFYRGLIAIKPYRRIPLQLSPHRRFIVYTDASCAAGDQLTNCLRLCWIVFEVGPDVRWGQASHLRWWTLLIHGNSTSRRARR